MDLNTTQIICRGGKSLATMFPFRFTSVAAYVATMIPFKCCCLESQDSLCCCCSPSAAAAAAGQADSERGSSSAAKQLLFAPLLAHSIGHTKSYTLSICPIKCIGNTEEEGREENADGDLSAELAKISSSHNLSRVRADLLWGLKVPVFVNSHLGPTVRVMCKMNI